MRDMLFCFPDEATAHQFLKPFGFDNPGPSGWDDDRVLRVTLTVAQQTGVDVASGRPIYTAAPDPRFWIVVSLPATSDALYAVPYCMREADREKALAGKPYVVRERFTAAQLANPWWISPQWAGVDYSNAAALPANAILVGAGASGAAGATGATGATGPAATS